VSFAAVDRACQAAGLAIFGGFYPEPGDKTPGDCQTLILLGPKEPGFWPRLQSSPEFDGPDPVDRWSERVIGKLANDLNATAIFPFGGPPYQPFIAWAQRSGRAWQSPVGLLVHDQAGLFVSFRGALAFSRRLNLPATDQRPPCDRCTTKPCLTACLAHALGPDGYDVPACHAWLDQPQGNSCMQGGCLVRRACPVSQSYGRLESQSAHHMRHFHKG